MKVTCFRESYHNSSLRNLQREYCFDFRILVVACTFYIKWICCMLYLIRNTGDTLKLGVICILIKKYNSGASLMYV